ncbi:TnsA endonuclease N-terminal domain-containing protein [Flavobacterium channae]|uniref:TnsA endonuclease N-terminal domain-containing protein n=1 Tax=Flavobacterium channae TaxID=2897181 RepID=UPI001E4D9DB0|nr:TnsA endonuclease N-terminal domain-containing protein [Flavobacterium channae]UGS24644.1 TnsA endonuclease N-terminal domain-containing protein [Flavobacterium channae]
MKNDMNYVFSQKKMRISLKKKRNISANEFSLTGQIKSLKRNDFVDFESSLERDYIHILEFDENVRYYYEQPLKIEFNDRYYIPDFFVEYWDGSKEVIEIKYNIDLIDNASKYVTKFKAAEEFCNSNNLTFRILTETDIRNNYLFNIKFLNAVQIRHTSNKSEYFNEFELLEQNMKKLKRTTPNKLLNSSTSCELKRAELIQYLWLMIIHKKIKIDLSIKLNMETEIWI